MEIGEGLTAGEEASKKPVSQEKKDTWRFNVNVIPAPVRQLLSTQSERIKSIKEEAKTGRVKSEKKTFYFDKYAMSSISFQGLKELGDLTEDQKRKLASELLSAYYDTTDSSWLMSRVPGEHYVLLDIEEDKSQVLQRAAEFLDKKAPEVIDGFYQEAGLKMSRPEVADVVWMAVGNQIDASKDTTKRCPIMCLGGRGDQALKIVQNAPATLELIFSPVILKGLKGLKEARNALAAKGEACLPLVMAIGPGEKEDVKIDLTAKEVDLAGKLVRVAEAEGLRQTSQPEGKKEHLLDEEIMKWAADNIAVETYFTLSQIADKIKAQNLEDRVYQEALVSVDLGKEGGQTLLAKSAPEVLAIEGAKLGGIDLSGMSKITKLIERGNYDRQRFDLQKLREGWGKFLNHWQVELTETFEDYDFGCDEYGGDGVKGVFIGGGEKKSVMDYVQMSLDLSGKWKELVEKFQKQEDSLGLFTSFLQKQETKGEAGSIFIKTAFIQTQAFLDIHRCGFMEVRSEGDIDSAMGSLKKYLKDEQHKEQRSLPATAVDRATFEELQQNHNHKFASGDWEYVEYGDVYLIFQKKPHK